MAFKRALWHSGLTYRQECHTCHTVIEYDDYKLDFRPWFADGFVYCPKCQTPLRHNENFAINAPHAATTVQPAVENDGTFAFCTQCGRKYTVGTDHFCASCGKKLD